MKAKITKKMTLGELVEKYPKAAEILAQKYGMQCVDCPMSAMESLEDGARAHGMSDRQIEEMIRELD